VHDAGNRSRHCQNECRDQCRPPRSGCLPRACRGEAGHYH
jgi:hypothetical protein